MKKLLITCSFLLTALFSDELVDILSKHNSKLFDYQFESNELESDKLSNSWLNPIRFRYSKSYTTQFEGKTIDSSSYSISIDQPIFRSGGIYYGIKYANALRNVRTQDIKLKKRKMIIDIVSILFNMKKNSMEQKKMQFAIKNDTIDIDRKRDSYKLELLDSSYLDQAMLKKSQDETTLLQLELVLVELKHRFSLLSDKRHHELKVPKLKLMNKQKYIDTNIEIKRDRYIVEQQGHNVGIQWAKHLPTVSVNGQYIDGDTNPLFARPGIKESYYTYGFSVSMPLDINAYNDIEISRVERLRSADNLIDRQLNVEKEYRYISSTLKILDKKIALSKKDEKIYKNLYKVTSNLVKAGEKTTVDSDVMFNSLQIRQIDSKIYAMDRQIELLKLYSRSSHEL